MNVKYSENITSIVPLLRINKKINDVSLKINLRTF